MLYGYASTKGAVSTPAQALAVLDDLLASGRLKDGLTLAESAIRQWPNEVPILVRGAHLATRIGRTVAAIELLSRAADLGDTQAARDRQAIIDQNAPMWHFRMMNDEIRNRAYDQALRRYVRSDSIVLDIGCGAGLLSMMASRAGAEHVYACEVSEIMHHQAISVFKQNGFDKKITVYNRHSHYLRVGEHLPRKADIIVAEVFDTGLLGEEALSTFGHAREHLLADGGKILPGRAVIHAQLIESDLLHKEATTSQCAGFDVTTLNQLSPSYFQARLSGFDARYLSTPNNILNFDFLHDQQENITKSHTFTCTESGLCHGVAFWFTLDFGDSISLSTGPKNAWNCWMQAICAFRQPQKVKTGELLQVKVTQTTNRITFELPT